MWDLYFLIKTNTYALLYIHHTFPNWITLVYDTCILWVTLRILNNLWQLSMPLPVHSTVGYTKPTTAGFDLLCAWNSDNVDSSSTFDVNTPSFLPCLFILTPTKWIKNHLTNGRKYFLNLQITTTKYAKSYFF